jgi:N-acetylglutamate synthase-like GNAT family acetyltransferase
MNQKQNNLQKPEAGQNTSQDVILRDGMNVTIRNAETRDVQRINEMHDRLSKETMYYRYLGPNKPPIEELERLCSLGFEKGQVLIATMDEPEERVIGITCFYIDAQDPLSAEPAIVVEDAFQGCGIGKMLLQELTRDASSQGVKEFRCHTLPANARVHHLIEQSGAAFETKYADGMRMFQVAVDPESLSMAA